jgi:hypothetical protein
MQFKQSYLLFTARLLYMFRVFSAPIIRSPNLAMSLPTRTTFNGLTPRPHMTCTCDCIYSFNVLLMMCAENTRNM